MEPDEVRSLYGGEYAERYNELWQESSMWEAEATHHVRSLHQLIGDDTRWLDAGCGTGWNLAHFPGVTRAGFDLSPEMIQQARVANPDARFLAEHDLRDDVAEWHDRWDLVTCTGQPWSYVGSMDEVETIATNLANWTSPGGRCWVPITDLTDLTGLHTPYPGPGDEVGFDMPVVTGVFWSLHDAGGFHRHMVAPALGFWIEVLARRFRRIEIDRWPHDPPFIPVARRVVIAHHKREAGDERPVEIIEHPVPEPAGGPTGPQEGGRPGEPTSVDAAPSGTSPVGPIKADPAQDHDREPQPTSVARPTGSEGPVGRVPGRPLIDQPLSYLLGRLRPWDRSFWRSARRRAPTLLTWARTRRRHPRS